MQTLLFIFTIFSLEACSYKSPTKEFGNYLHSHHSIKLTDTLAIYVLLPGNQCINCVYIDGSHIPANIKDKVVFISTFPKERFKNVNQYYNDPSDKMLQLKLLEYESKIVVCKDSKVKWVIPLRNFQRQMDSLSISLSH